MKKLRITFKTINHESNTIATRFASFIVGKSFNQDDHTAIHRKLKKSVEWKESEELLTVVYVTEV